LAHHAQVRKRDRKVIFEESEQSEWIDDLRRFLEEMETKQVAEELQHKDVEAARAIQKWLVGLDSSQASKDDMMEEWREQDV
jgi:hypothetical protein